jgi:acetoin utilization deacetylase AcuC-like enzyme
MAVAPVVFTHSACFGHDTGPDHPECPERLGEVIDSLRSIFDQSHWREAPRASRGQLLRVHDARLLDAVLETRPEVRIMLDPDTVLSPASAEAALRAAGAGVAAVDAVLRDETPSAFCAVRPPGHHATASTAMGFCLFNSIAVAARHALDGHGLSRVAIADFDVHHGNGTQAIFEADPRVLYLSSHQWPLYPDSGRADEHGMGNIFNVTLPPGAGGPAFRAAWRQTLLPALDAFRPQLVLVSAGFDAHWRDPLAQLRLGDQDYAWITRQLATLAARHAQGRIVSMLEGGYDLQALRESSLAHARALARGVL